MSKPSNINSLAALRERREEIAVEQEAAKKGLTSALAAAPAKAKDYALEDLALPALGVGLAVYIGYRLVRSGKSRDRAEVEITSSPGVPAETSYSAPAPAVQSRMQPTPTPRQRQATPVKKSLLSIGTLVTAGKLLIPAAQAIIGVVQNQQTKQQTEQKLESPKEHIAAPVA